MSFTPGVLRRQSGMLNVKSVVGAPLDDWKDARLTLPYQNEMVDCILSNKSESMRCKYDYRKKQWISEAGDPAEVAIWKKSTEGKE